MARSRARLARSPLPVIGIGRAYAARTTMNFPAHAWTAHAAGVAEPQALLGTMLPDLASLVAVRFGDQLPAAVERGRQLHHVADAAFHDHPTFRTGVASLRSELREAGLATGARRAAAHVGYELLLDATLQWHEPARVAFDAALATGAGLADVLDDDAQRARWVQLVIRLREVDIPARISNIEEVAERVGVILTRRPRLSLAAGDLVPLVTALGNAEASIATAAPRLLADLVADLRNHDIAGG